MRLTISSGFAIRLPRTDRMLHGMSRETLPAACVQRYAAAVSNTGGTAEHGAAPNAPNGTVTPLAPARYKLTVTIGAETYEKLRQAQDLLRHSVPNGDLAILLDRAFTLLLHFLEEERGLRLRIDLNLGLATQPRSQPHTIAMVRPLPDL